VAVRLVVGAVGATAIAAAAYRVNSLSRGGAVMATLVGAVAFGAGWGWAALLVAFFVVSSALSRIGATERELRTAALVQKGGARDAVQVAANGGLFALAAAGYMLWPHDSWLAVGAGALAAAASDSWATELGTLARRPPRLLVGWRPVPAGTSGAVSGPGMAAALAGALFIGTVAWLAGWPLLTAASAIVGGVGGSLADSLLGATIQGRRRCDACGTMTERIVHDCGQQTLPAGGLSWVDNDMVNGAATLVGAFLTLALALSIQLFLD